MQMRKANIKPDAEIKLGQQVKVYADYGKEVRKEYPGIVTWISDTSEFTPKPF